MSKKDTLLKQIVSGMELILEEIFFGISRPESGDSCKKNTHRLPWSSFRSMIALYPSNCFLDKINKVLIL